MSCLLQEQPDYRLAVIFILNHLTVMDERPVTVEEKVILVYSIYLYPPVMFVFFD